MKDDIEVVDTMESTSRTSVCKSSNIIDIRHVPKRLMERLTIGWLNWTLLVTNWIKNHKEVDGIVPKWQEINGIANELEAGGYQ